MIGQRINNYEVKSLLGEGGMGAVYLAEHPFIGRQVAVKVLLPGFAKEPDLVARFFNEAKAANSIGHPNIIDVIDVGTLPDGLPYLVMELLKGESLASRLERVGKLDVGLVLELGRQATSALQAAHAAGIVHRDLKPANLFLTSDRDDPSRTHLKVLDFGIAKLSSSLQGNQVKTGTGAILGTPVYMSPEQSLGRSAAIDSRTDIYSLGVILYHALAGEPPFVAEGFGEMMLMHMQAEVPPLHARNGNVPSPLEALVARALAKKPEDRFQAMAEMGEALSALGSSTGRASAWDEFSRRSDRATMVLPQTLERTVRLPAGAASPERTGASRSSRKALGSTTFSGAASERSGEEAASFRSSRLRHILGGALVAVAGLGLVLGLSGSSRHSTRLDNAPASAAAPAPSAPSTGRPALESTPPDPVGPSDEVPAERRSALDESRGQGPLQEHVPMPPETEVKKLSAETAGNSRPRKRRSTPTTPTSSEGSKAPGQATGSTAAASAPAKSRSLMDPPAGGPPPTKPPPVREPIKF
jgi:serine/threonine protein kinase